MYFHSGWQFFICFLTTSADVSLSLCVYIFAIYQTCVSNVFFFTALCVASPLADLFEKSESKTPGNYSSLWSKLGFRDPGEALFYQLPKICGIQSSARTTKARPKHPAERPKTVSPRHRTSFVIPKGCGKNILRDV